MARFCTRAMASPCVPNAGFSSWRPRTRSTNVKNRKEYLLWELLQ
jgi:hypothetical protein